MRRDRRLKALRITASLLLGAYAVYLPVANPVVMFALAGRADQVGLADFGSFYESGHAAIQGLDPYEVYPLTLDAARGRGNGAAPNLNAPFSVPILAMVALMDPWTGRYVWFVGSLLAYLATAVVVLRAAPHAPTGLVLPFLFCLAGLFETLMFGQIYAFLALISTLAWLLLETRPLVAGTLIGFLTAIKPNFVLWPVLLFAAGHRRSALAGGISTIALGAVPVALYGTQIYGEWLASIAVGPPNASIANASLSAIAERCGAPRVVGLVLVGLLILGVTAWAWRRRPSTQHVSSAALIGVLLASPIAWVGYSVFLVPSVVRSLGWPLLAVVVGALLMLPRPALEEWSGRSIVIAVTVGSAYTTAWLLLLARELSGDRSGSAS